MKNRAYFHLIWLALLFLVVSLACGAAAPEATSTPPPPPTEAPAPTEPPPPTESLPPTDTPQPEATPTSLSEAEVKKSGAVASLGDVRNAVIQIEAEGTFIDPEYGWEVNVGKRGTGFFIDPSGIAVTNNHVVTGAAILRVWVAGEDEPRNARILGVSECSDLAVIDVEGDGYAYLDWMEGNIDVGQAVFAAGFPLGDPEFTLTDGIVSKAEADGESSWASVDSVIEHTAKINPGNSGGPLVGPNGELIGVNYATVSEFDQNFAISRDVAESIIATLSGEEDVNSIGVNGGAVYGTIGTNEVSGVWVRSVESGSPADKAGILPGDLLYQLEGEVLATDGSMADYCDILRSRSPKDTMSVVVIRTDDLSMWEGQLNGKALEMTGYLDGGTSGDTGTGTGDLPANCVAAETPGYMECVDDTNSILVEVPDYWTDFDGSEWILDDEAIGVAISAAPYLQDFYDYYDADGLFFGASDTFAQWGGYVQFLDIYSEDYKSGCDFDGRFDYDDGLYRGKYDFFTNCGGAGGYDTYVLSAVPIDNPTASIILVITQVPAGETAIVDQIWNTFLVGDL